MTDASGVTDEEHASALRANIDGLPRGTSVIIYDHGTMPLEEDLWSPRVRECVAYALRRAWVYRTSIDVPADPEASARVQLERVLRAMDVTVGRRTARRERPCVERPPVALLVHDEAQIGGGGTAAGVAERVTRMGAHLVVLAWLEGHRCAVGAS